MPVEGFPRGSVSKESSCNAGDADSILELGRSPGEENGTPLQYSHLQTPWTDEPDGLQSLGSQGLRDDQTAKHTAQQNGTMWPEPTLTQSSFSFTRSLGPHYKSEVTKGRP